MQTAALQIGALAKRTTLTVDAIRFYEKPHLLRKKIATRTRSVASGPNEPVAAVIAALSTLACCLPFGFLGAVGLAGLSVWARSYAAWFLALAVVLLVLGFVQLYHGRTQCRKRSTVSMVLFWVAAVIVLLIILFPQVIASLVAG